MVYPGSPEKDQKVQQRILAAFKEAVRLYQDGHRDECQTVLRSILEVDPLFRPAQRLESAIIEGSPVDLGQLLGDLADEGGGKAEGIVARARQALNEGKFAQAAELAQEVLRDLPGHKEARLLWQQAESALKAESQVATQLARAREALSAGLADEARGFLEIVRQLNPHHPELAVLEEELQAKASQGPELSFETFTPPPGQVSLEVAEVEQSSLEPEPQVELEAPWETSSKQGMGGFAFDSLGQELAFGSGGETTGTTQDRVNELLIEGQEAFDRGDYGAAVDIWSRIYLIDPQSEEADRRIEQARRRQDELTRLAEMKFADAREAFERGELEQARALLREVLSLQPQHLDANDLLSRLETPEVPPPLDHAAVEEDLFRDDFVPQAIAAEESSSSAATVAAVRPRAEARPKVAPKQGLPLPLPLLVGVGLASAVLVVVAVLFGGKVFERGSQLEDTLAEAERLAQQGQLRDAVNLLQALDLDGPEANQVQQRILEYQRRLRAEATPKPAVDATPVKQALAEGKHLRAARLLWAEKKKGALNEELRALLAQITSYEAGLPALVDAWEKANWEGAVHLLEEMVKVHPEDGELKQAFQFARYNWGLSLLQRFEVTEAAKLFEELHQETADAEVSRVLEMAKNYRTRSVDPRYTIFVNSLRVRDFPK